MASGELSNDLSLGNLMPTPSIRPVESHSQRQDAHGKARRRSRAESENPESDDNSVAQGEDHHQIDRLA